MGWANIFIPKELIAIQFGDHHAHPEIGPAQLGAVRPQRPFIYWVKRRFGRGLRLDLDGRQGCDFLPRSLFFRPILFTLKKPLQREAAGQAEKDTDHCNSENRPPFLFHDLSFSLWDVYLHYYCIFPLLDIA